MAFGGLVITSAGRNALIQAQNGEKLIFTHIEIGQGMYQGSYSEISELVEPVTTLSIGNIKIKGDECILEADLNNANLDKGYYFREIAVFVKQNEKELLYVYDNAGADAELIPSSKSQASVEKRIRLSLKVFGVDEIKIEAASVLYLPQMYFEEHEANQDIHVDAKRQAYWNEKAETDAATQLENGLMAAADKKKLDGVEEKANNYTHPAAHSPGIITQDSSNRFVTDAEKSNWNGKATTAVATQAANGLMAAADKAKLDGVAQNANNYIHPGTHDASMITQDAARRFVSDAEKGAWNGKAETSVATQLSNGLMASADKKKLDGVADSANNYTHPSNHPADIITPDAAHRFVTDTEKSNWNAKAGTATATQTGNGLMGAVDKKKLDGIAENANNYTHPASHAASMITPDATHRFVTDVEKSSFLDKYTKSEVDNLFSSLETNTDWKESVSTFADIARIYPKPDNGWTVNVKDSNITYRYSGTAWIAISANAIPKVTTAVDGLMTKEDKTKLNNIADRANNYTHPAAHSADIITPDATHRFVTDVEKSNWNGKAGTGTATQSANGLMAAADKAKLDGVAQNANNYTHPANHAASMITLDATHRFTTDAEKSTWNAAQQNAINAIKALMSNQQLNDTTKIPTSALVYALAQEVSSLNSSFLNKTYPIGSIYMSVNAVNPKTLFGGTWIAWGTGRIPVGLDTGQTEFNITEKTGGTKTINLSHSHTSNAHTHTTGNCTLSIGQLPVHNHYIDSNSGNTNNSGSHVHGLEVVDYAWMGGSGANRYALADAGPISYDLSQRAGEHSHNVSVNATNTNNTGLGQSHNHGNTGSGTSSTDAQLSTTQSILPPFITCYMWKRTS